MGLNGAGQRIIMSTCKRFLGQGFHICSGTGRSVSILQVFWGHGFDICTGTFEIFWPCLETETIWGFPAGESRRVEFARSDVWSVSSGTDLEVVDVSGTDLKVVVCATGLWFVEGHS